MDGPQLLRVVTQLRGLSPDLGSEGTGRGRVGTPLPSPFPALSKICLYVLYAPERKHVEV